MNVPENDHSLFDWQGVVEILGIDKPTLKRMIRDGFIGGGLFPEKGLRSTRWMWSELKHLGIGHGIHGVGRPIAEVETVNGRLLMDEYDVMKALGIDRGNVRRAVRMKHLPRPIRLGNRLMWRSHEVLHYIRQASYWNGLDMRNKYGVVRDNETPLVDKMTVPDELKYLSEDLHEFTPAKFSAVYFLVRNGKVVYIGSTTYLSARIAQHRGKDFDRVLYFRVDEARRLAVEAELIRLHQPPLNIASNPASDRPRRKGPPCSGPSPDPTVTG